MNDNKQEIPLNATIRQQYVKCSNSQCQKKHGPYLYAYWKEGNKTKSRYVGKKLEDYDFRKIAKDYDLRPSQLLKFKFIKQEASRGNVLAKQYFKKLKNKKVSIDWAHRVLINRIREQNELIKFIVSEMKKEGLDPSNEEDLRGYLNKPCNNH
jgi:transcriptional accessory protein Tex/SPT6